MPITESSTWNLCSACSTSLTGHWPDCSARQARHSAKARRPLKSLLRCPWLSLSGAILRCWTRQWVVAVWCVVRYYECLPVWSRGNGKAMNIRKAIADSAPFAIRRTWIVLLCVPTSWILMSSAARSGALSTSGSVAAAAWLQAIGSILAIAGAGFFPYFHEAQKDRNRSGRLRRIILLLARNQKEQLRLLQSTRF